MVTHKDLPTGSRQWASSVDKVADKVSHLEAIVQRVTKDLRLDYSDPTRQYNKGNVPSVQKPVQMKMSSMHDIEVPNVQDGDVLTWDGLKGRWVAGRYDGPAKPTDHGQGRGVHPDDPLDPDEPDVPDEPTPDPNLALADTFSEQDTRKNLSDDTDLRATQTGFRTYPTFTIAEVQYGGQPVMSSGITMGENGQFTITDAGASGGFNAVETPWDKDQWTRPWYKMSASAPVSVYTYIKHVDGGNTTYSNAARFVELTSTPQIVGDIGDFYGPQGDPTLPGQAYMGIFFQAGSPSSVVTIERAGLYPEGVPEYQVMFDGDTPDNPPLFYSWDAGSNASTSTFISADRIKAPSTVRAGNLMQILGEGFPPNGPVWVGTYASWSPEYETVADGNGAFEFHYPVPEGTPASSDTVFAYGDAYGWGEVDYTITAS